MAVLNTTSTLSNEVAVYYERRFLERARAMLVHQEGGQLRALEGNAGKEVIFNRFSPLALATTSLPTEGKIVALVKSALNTWESLGFCLA